MADLSTASAPVDLAQYPLDLDLTIDLTEFHDPYPEELLGPPGDLGDACGLPLDLEEPCDLKALHAEAVTATHGAVRQAERARDDEVASMGQRMCAEQERLFQILMQGLPGAVREAAASGQRTAVLLRFTGADRLDEFCYLYMLKGPHNPEHRVEMRRMGARPLLQRLRHELQPAGFGVHHSWQRATNDNTLTVSW